MENIIAHYEQCLERFRGDHALEVDWKDTEQVETRNKMFWNFMYSPYTKTFLDFGCGTASFYRYKPTSSYNGCDASLKMVEEARKRYQTINVFHLPIGQELDKSYESIIVSGVFTEKRDLDWNTMYSYVENTLKMLLKHTNKGLAVNFMNSHSIEKDKQRDELFFMDFNTMAKLATTLGIKKYSIDATYLPYEATLKLYII